MSSNISKYPSFDKLESQVDLEYSNHIYQKLQPVATGETVSELLRYQPSNFSGSQNTQRSGSSLPYLNKILVVYFYSKHWGATALEHLKQLNAIRNEVKYHDGSILVIDGDGPDSKLQQLLWSNNLSLQVYTDPGHQIAGLFKVYSESSPAWSRYAGIDANAPLPATFVLNHFLRVVFANANEGIETRIGTDQVVNAVYHSNHYQAGKKTA